MRNLVFFVVMLRKIVTNGWVHVSPAFVSRDRGRWGDCWHCMNHRNKKLFINKSPKALIKLKEGHQDLLKLHVPLRGCSTVGGKVGIQKGDFVWSRKTTCIVCIGRSTPPQKHHPLFFGKSPLPLNLQTIQAPPFSDNSPLYSGSLWLHPLKIWFFSEPS